MVVFMGGVELKTGKKLKYMRLITITALLILGLSFDSIKNASLQSNKLNGTWIPVMQEIGGKKLQEEAFATQKLVINDSLYTYTAESIDNGVLKYTDGKMDIYGRVGVNSGKHFTAIYKFEKEQLVICYNLSGKDYPETFVTKGNKLFLLCVYKRE